MADYYSILNKTIAGLPSNTAETRAFVYAKARQAIESRLKAISPPPGKEAIAKQMQVLEDAVHRIEADQVLQELMAPSEPDPVPPPPRPQPQVQSNPPAQQYAQPAAGREPAAAKSAPAALTPGNFAPGKTPSGNAAPDVSIRGGNDGLGARGPGPQARVAPQPRTGTPAYDSSLDSIDTLDRGSGRPGKVRRDPPAGKRRGSGWIGATLSFLMLALLAAGAYGLWLNKEPLMAALGIEADFGFGKPDEQAQSDAKSEQQQEQPKQQEAPAVREASGNSQSAKEDVRLNESGQSVPGQQAAESGSEQSTAQSGQSGAAQEEVKPGEVNPVNEGQQNNGEAAGQSGNQSGTQAGGEQVAAPAIGQKAFLYEEGSAGAGATRDNAAVVWSLVQEAPAEGSPEEAVIRGQLDVPGRGLTLQISIKRNTDEALPASHVIELLFTVPADFSGGNIDNVARFVMKANEQARGEGLVAVPAKIDAGYFLIALNNLPQAVETNRKLMIESSWIDIPLGYTSGRRALVALEKGAVGDKVFRDAFVDWDKR